MSSIYHPPIIMQNMSFAIFVTVTITIFLDLRLKDAPKFPEKYSFWGKIPIFPFCTLKTVHKAVF